ncbi:protein of unknown function [Petrocella atlantisensis]|uniref:Uncharacterized protein n=1 Tax=Petrocella atlantisensis TaxID=2173034 RepID=A0A3P7P384_9FIRM|nr:protein of unknown function [Petrocella atlantisensis]
MTYKKLEAPIYKGFQAFSVSQLSKTGLCVSLKQITIFVKNQPFPCQWIKIVT